MFPLILNLLISLQQKMFSTKIKICFSILLFFYKNIQTMFKLSTDIFGSIQPFLKNFYSYHCKSMPSNLKVPFQLFGHPYARRKIKNLYTIEKKNQNVLAFLAFLGFFPPISNSSKCLIKFRLLVI